MKSFLIITLIWLIHVYLLAQDSNYVEINGVKIYYETHGKGEPLLLLHGFSLSHKAWDEWIEDLSQDYYVITPDLRGHGKSTNPSKVYTHKLTAQDMYELMNHLEIKKFKAIGQSSGAMTLIQMATMDTSRIASMILIAGTSYYPETCRSIQRNIYYETLNEGWKSSLEYHHPGGEEQIRMLIDQFRGMAESYDDMNFTPPYLSKIKSQTLIIHGDRDPFFPIDIPVTLYKAIPNSYLWIVPNDGHIPIGIYDKKSIWSDVFLTVLREFMNDQW